MAFVSMTFAFLGFLVVQLQGIAIGGVPSTNIAGVVLAENEAQAERNPTTRLILGIPQTAMFSKYILMQLYVDALVGSRVQPQDHSQEGHCAEVPAPLRAVWAQGGHPQVRLHVQ